tara:strand:+ start:628 stop:912 length:285 start_codon:yes stop_codon:yes gene_type:complete
MVELTVVRPIVFKWSDIRDEVDKPTLIAINGGSPCSQQHLFNVFAKKTVGSDYDGYYMTTDGYWIPNVRNPRDRNCVFGSQGIAQETFNKAQRL